MNFLKRTIFNYPADGLNATINENVTINEFKSDQVKLFKNTIECFKEQQNRDLSNIKFKLSHSAQLNENVTLIDSKSYTEFGTIKPTTDKAVRALNAISDTNLISAKDLYIEKCSTLAFGSDKIPNVKIFRNSNVVVDETSIIDDVICDNHTNVHGSHISIKHSHLSNVNISDDVRIEASWLDGALYLPDYINDVNADCNLIIKNGSCIENSIILLNNLLEVEHVGGREAWCKLNQLQICGSTLKYVRFIIANSEMVRHILSFVKEPDNTYKDAYKEIKHSKIINSHLEYFASCYFLDIQNTNLYPNRIENAQNDNRAILDIGDYYNCYDVNHVLHNMPVKISMSKRQVYKETLDKLTVTTENLYIIMRPKSK